MRLYTIGYSGYEYPAFIEALNGRRIDLLIDVRSVPASGYRPEYDGRVLARRLPENGIEYRHMPEAFGARRNEAELTDAEGCVDFEKTAASPAFCAGIREIADAVEDGKTCALMCAEKDAMGCHRAIMIGRRFRELGWQVIHIAPDGEETQEELGKRLLDLYFPGRYQLSMLETPRSDEELLAEAYRMQNRRIGFRKDE